LLSWHCESDFFCPNLDYRRSLVLHDTMHQNSTMNFNCLVSDPVNGTDIQQDVPYRMLYLYRQCTLTLWRISSLQFTLKNRLVLLSSPRVDGTVPGWPLDHFCFVSKARACDSALPGLMERVNLALDYVYSCAQ